MGSKSEHPTILYQDNQGAIVLANQTMTTARSKHIDIKYHYVRDCIQDNTVKCIYIPTGEICLTKAVPVPVLNYAASVLFSIVHNPGNHSAYQNVNMTIGKLFDH